MKTIYKILFSLCSTLICVMHSARSFGAACPYYSGLDSSDSDGIPNNACEGKASIRILGKACGTYETGSYIALAYGVDGCVVYAHVQECATCEIGYEFGHVTQLHITSNLPGTCEITLNDCSEIPDDEAIVNVTCTSWTGCGAALGSIYKHVYAYDETNGRVKAYYVQRARCNKTNCDWDNTISTMTAQCTNDYYGSAVVTSSAGSILFSPFCQPCPDVDEENFGVYAGVDVRDVISGGTAKSACRIDNGANFTDGTGEFTLTSAAGCMYMN